MPNWYEVDDLRETWCILTVQVEDIEPPQLVSWQLGDGNMTQLVQTESETTEGSLTRSDLCKRLGEALDSRRHPSRLLVTRENRTLGQVRQILLSCEGIQNPTLRGFRHVSVSDVLSEYFAEADIESLSSEPPESKRPMKQHTTAPESVGSLWYLWSEIAPLLPASVLQGREL